MKKISKETRKELLAKYNHLASELMETEDLAKANEIKQKLILYSSLLDESRTEWKISPDTLLVVVGNLAGILLILKFEKLDVIATKAIGFVIKGRV